jgi:transposase
MVGRTAIPAVLEVLDGSPVGEVAVRYGVSRQTVYTWKAKLDDLLPAPRARREASRRAGRMCSRRERRKAPSSEYLAFAEFAFADPIRFAR